MRKNKIFIFSGIFLFTLSIICALFIFLPEQISSETSINDELAAARSKLSDLLATQKKLEKSYNDAKSNKKATVKSKQLIEEQLISLEEEIDTYNGYIEKLNNNIVNLETQIYNSEKAYQDYYEKFKMRVRINYESGELTYLEIFLTAKDFADLLTRMDYVSSIVEYDKNLLDNMINEINSIKENKANLEVSMDESKTAMSNLEQRKITQALKQEQLELEIKDIDNDLEYYQEQQEEYARLELEFEAQISELLDKQRAFIGENFIWPLPGHSKITSKYGYRTLYGKREFHYAIDIGAPKGTEIVASNTGEVIYASWTNTGGGNKIVIDHGGEIATHYNHLSKILVKVGDFVSKGDIIGLVGSTGNSTGNHLDFKILKKGQALDPLLYVNPQNNPPELTLN